MKPAVLGLLSSVSLFAMATPGAAGCLVSGEVITCTDTTSAPIVANNVEQMSVASGAVLDVEDDDAVTLSTYASTVQNAGTIRTSGDDGGDALVLDDADWVSNAGLIAAVDDAIQAGDSLTVGNDGEIRADDKGITAGSDVVIDNRGDIVTGDEGVNLDHRAVVTNHGQIIAGDRGIDVKDHATIDNFGTIISDDEGIEMNDFGRLDNRGTIVAADDGVNPAEAAEILNRAGAMIDGGDDGIDIDSGAIVNIGTILGRGGAAVDVDAAENDLTVLTYGTMQGLAGIQVEDGSDGDANLRSQNLLLGVTDTQTLTRFGVDTLVPAGAVPSEPQVDLIATDGDAAYLAAGDDLVMIQGNVAIAGDVRLGEGEDAAVFLDLPSLYGEPTGVTPVAASTVDQLIFDGGAGMDLASFALPQTAFLSMASVAGADVILAVTDPLRGNPFDLVLRNFEEVSLFDGPGSPETARFDVASIAALTSEVPLPAGVLLMSSALAGLGALRRRR